MDADYITIEWVDSGREPQCAPNPDYPEGIDIDFTAGEDGPCCIRKLPYPARRCGLYAIKCSLCGITVARTTAGRVDDPRSVKILCRQTEE